MATQVDRVKIQQFHRKEHKKKAWEGISNPAYFLSSTELENNSVKWVWMLDCQFPKVTEVVGLLRWSLPSEAPTSIVAAEESWFSLSHLLHGIQYCVLPIEKRRRKVKLSRCTLNLWNSINFIFVSFVQVVACFSQQDQPMCVQLQTSTDQVGVGLWLSVVLLIYSLPFLPPSKTH